MCILLLLFICACSVGKQDTPPKQERNTLTINDSLRNDSAYKRGLEHSIEEKLLPKYKKQIKREEQ